MPQCRTTIILILEGVITIEDSKKRTFFLIKHQSIFNEINLYSISYILFMNSVHANTVKKVLTKSKICNVFKYTPILKGS